MLQLIKDLESKQSSLDLIKRNSNAGIAIHAMRLIARDIRENDSENKLKEVESFLNGEQIKTNETFQKVAFTIVNSNPLFLELIRNKDADEFDSDFDRIAFSLFKENKARVEKFIAIKGTFCFDKSYRSLETIVSFLNDNADKAPFPEAERGLALMLEVAGCPERNETYHRTIPYTLGSEKDFEDIFSLPRKVDIYGNGHMDMLLHTLVNHSFLFQLVV